MIIDYRGVRAALECFLLLLIIQQISKYALPAVKVQYQHESTVEFLMQHKNQLPSLQTYQQRVFECLEKVIEAWEQGKHVNIEVVDTASPLDIDDQLLNHYHLPACF